MKFKFTDLEKTLNYFGFESGIYCYYPNPTNEAYANTERDFCEQSKNFIKDKNYFTSMNELPTHYDPRCRPWYQRAYKLNTTIFSDPYQFVDGSQGMTTCIPLWREPSAKQIQNGINKNEKQFRGSYCFDVMPTSRDDKFLRKYYDIKDYHIDYLIFNPDEKFEQHDYINSNFGNLTKDIVFNRTLQGGQVYEVKEIKIEQKKLNELNEYMMEYRDQYDLSDIALLPKEPISIGEVKVKNETNDEIEFLFFLNDFDIDLLSIRDDQDLSQTNRLQKFQFALFLPKSIIQTKIDKVYK